MRDTYLPPGAEHDDHDAAHDYFTNLWEIQNDLRGNE